MQDKKYIQIDTMGKIILHTAKIEIEIKDAKPNVMSDVWQTLNDLYKRHMEEIQYKTISHDVNEYV